MYRIIIYFTDTKKPQTFLKLRLLDFFGEVNMVRQEGLEPTPSRTGI